MFRRGQTLNCLPRISGNIRRGIVHTDRKNRSARNELNNGIGRLKKKNM